MDIKNITLKEFALSEKQNEYDAILFALRPKNLFCGKSMNVQEMQYIETRRCISLLQKGKDWNNLADVFSISFGVDKQDFWSAKVVEFYAARNFLVHEWKRVIEIENRFASNIKTKDADKWRRAGVERLNKFSEMIGVERLAQRYSLYPFDLAKKPYGEIFYLLSLTAEDSEVNNNYHTLK